jgi:hypothetical protein
MHPRTQGGWDFLGPGKWSTRIRLFALVLAVINVALVWHFRVPAISSWQDDAQYILLSREVAHGDYRDSHDVSAPPHAKYPPGYPTFLAGLSAVFGERETVFLCANALLSAGALLLFLAWGRRRLSVPVWAAVGMLVALNPETILVSGKVLSEPLFLFVVYLALWIETRDPPGKSSGTWWATIVGSLVTVVRSAGLAISVGLIGARLVQRRWAAAAALALLTLATGGYWAWYSARAPQSQERALYVADFQKVLAIDESPIRAAGQRVRYKAEELTIDELPTALSIPVLKGQVIDNAIGAAVIVVLLPLGIFLLWKSSTSAAAVLLAYGALYVVWPYGQVRLIVPAVPLILVALFLAAEYLGSKVRRPWAAPAAVALLGVYFALGSAVRLFSERRMYDGCVKGDAPRSQAACFPREEDWAFMQAAAYLKDQGRPGAVVFTDKDAAVYYLTGHKTENANVLLREDSTTIADALRDRGVEWVVTSYVGPLRHQIGSLLAKACHEFELVRQFDTHTAVLRVRQAYDTSGNACDALAIWRRETQRETGGTQESAAGERRTVAAGAR